MFWYAEIKPGLWMLVSPEFAAELSHIGFQIRIASYYEVGYVLHGRSGLVTFPDQKISTLAPRQPESLTSTIAPLWETLGVISGAAVAA